jgi:hypothetical protein
MKETFLTLLTGLVTIYDHNEVKIRLDEEVTQSVDISRGVRQGCRLSPTLLIMHVNKILSEWNTRDIQGMQLTRNKHIKTLHFADDGVIRAECNLY